jgi:hypothetical protein
MSVLVRAFDVALFVIVFLILGLKVPYWGAQDSLGADRAGTFDANVAGTSGEPTCNFRIIHARLAVSLV